MLNVAALYHIWPHYRAAVMTALDESKTISYTFMAGGESFEGIPHISPDHVKNFEIAKYRKFGRFGWQWKAVSIAFSDRFDVLIYLADPNMLSTWIGASVARLRGVPVIFWGHGWRRRESRSRELIRGLFFRLAKRMFVYAPRGRSIGIETGYPQDRITVVYNSLDANLARGIVSEIEAGKLAAVNPRSYFSDPERPLIVCSARMTYACRFDLLLEAARALRETGLPINIMLVGDGPERTQLETLAATLDVQVFFFGACYDESTVGQIIYHSDIVVSPGKIGLTAMHSLMYGTPAITHSNFDEQMPEVEAIDEGRTGTFFLQNDAKSLSEAIKRWLQTAPDRTMVRSAAWNAIQACWCPDKQAEIIEKSITELLGRVTSK